MCEECKEIESEEKVRKVFTDHLPRWEEKDKGMGNKGTINWQKCINEKVKFIYEDIEGEVEIVNYEPKKRLLFIKYKNKEPFKIVIGNFTKCRLAGLLKEELYVPQYDESNPRRVDLRNLPLNSHGIDWYTVAKNKINIPFVYNDIKGEVQVIDYNGKVLTLKYLNKSIHKINTANFGNGQLGELLGTKTSEFKIEIGTHFKDDKRDLIIIDRKYYKNEKDGVVYKVYQYKCNKCGFECGEHYKNGQYQEEYWIDEGNLNRGNGCACCCPTPRIVVEGINDIPTTNPEMVKFFQGGYDEAKLYTKSSGQKICPICPDCGRIRDKLMTINHIYKKKTIGCSCGDGQSYPFKFMYNVLDQLDVKFETEYNPDWIKPKRFDFYFEINNNKYIIETDGGFHNQDNKMSGGKTAEESKEIDNYKDKLAKEHGIEVVRIDCIESDLEYIKNNILIRLNDLLDLNNIKWNLAEEFALSNLCKKACEIKRDNPDMTTKEIGNIMNLSYSTITNYLKKGSKVWHWCNYDPKEELKKSVARNGRKKGKLVAIFKDGIKLDEFKSVSDLVRQSEEKFGVKLNSSNISEACRNINKIYKGFTFKYI